MSEYAGIAIEKKDRAVVARLLVKTLDDAGLKTLARMLDDASQTDPTLRGVVLDFGQVSMVPSLALGLLVQIGNKCRARQQQLKLARVQPQVRKVFSVTRLDRIFQFADTVESALPAPAQTEPD